MNARTTAAVAAGRTAALLSRALCRGGGTALPGLVAERIDPDIVRHLGARLGGGTVLITGTNGKTTASRILASILDAAGTFALHNREGSNMMRGLASTLLASRNGRGAASATLGLFEVDEATLPAAARALAPRALAFTNLFRDQLDRYGEVDTVAAMWREALAAAPRDATLVHNADDPSVAELALGWEGPVHWFGIDDASFATEFTGSVDARWCRACGGSFAYDRRYFGHAGFWRCTSCGRARPATGTTATAIELRLEGSAFEVLGLGRVTMPLTGLYNVANALAAIALARVLEAPGEAILAGLANVRAAFGRQEVVHFEGRRLMLMLAKNPAGADQVLRLIAAVAPTIGESVQVAILLNDRFADGQDVSWIWDVDYELLATTVAACWAGGDRAEDMALRLKYAGWPPPAGVEGQPSDLLDRVHEETARGDLVFVIPTYTAMLDLRAELAERGAVSRFWDDQP